MRIPTLTFLLTLFLTPITQAQALPPGFAQAVARAGIPAEAISVYLAPVENAAAPLFAHRANTPMNPASVMKLVTTYAALDILGPAYTWKTPVFTDGRIKSGVLQGNLYLQGSGSPQMVIEDLWLMARRISALGIRDISGDVILDPSAFQTPKASPSDFDGEGLRAYNALPQALLLNFSSMLFEFTPIPGSQTASVHMTPALKGLTFTQEVPLTEQSCADWKAGLELDYNAPHSIRFKGSYPRSCGAQFWPIAHQNVAQYNAMLIGALLESVGINVKGNITTGPVSVKAKLEEPLLVETSKPLAQVIWGVNKYSNNVMARNVFLSIGLHTTGLGSLETARRSIESWWRERLPNAPAPFIDNGAGLSLEARLSAASLGQMLQHAHQSALMPEFMASMPLVGVDGTLRRSRALSTGKAHLKTGTMPRSGVSALAGYVHGSKGRRLVLVAIINHPRAAQARAALDTLIDEAVVIADAQ